MRLSWLGNQAKRPLKGFFVIETQVLGEHRAYGRARDKSRPWASGHLNCSSGIRHGCCPPRAAHTRAKSSTAPGTVPQGSSRGSLTTQSLSGWRASGSRQWYSTLQCIRTTQRAWSSTGRWDSPRERLLWSRLWTESCLTKIHTLNSNTQWDSLGG